MRALGLIGLLLALVVVGVLARKQMTAAATGDVRMQGRQIQQQIQQSLDAAQQRRPVPDDD